MFMRRKRVSDRSLAFRAFEFAVYSALIWIVVVSFGTDDENVVWQVVLTCFVGSAGQLLNFVLIALCRKHGRSGIEEYFLSIPFRTGVYLVCVLLTLSSCDKDVRRSYAVCVLCGYFLTFPFHLLSLFPSEKHATERALAQEVSEKTKSSSEKL